MRDGAAVAVAEHVARLNASARALYGLQAPPSLAQAIDEAASAHDGRRRRLRITLTPDGATTVTTAPIRQRELPVVLVPFTLPGGLGAHKWRDRELLDQLTAEAHARSGTANAAPLLLDGAGNVLEASWAAVVAIERPAAGTALPRTDPLAASTEHATLLTPPLDGRILPSVSRRRLLARARARGQAVVETTLPLARLAAADEIVLTSALGEARAVLASAPARRP